MPHEGYVDLVTNDGPGFHSGMPISELAEPDTRAIEASAISLAPPAMETEDGVCMKHGQPLPSPTGLGGSSRPTLNRETGVRRPARGGPEAASHRTRARGENTDEPQWPSLDPPRSGQGHLNLLVRS